MKFFQFLIDFYKIEHLFRKLLKKFENPLVLSSAMMSSICSIHWFNGLEESEINKCFYFVFYASAFDI